MAIDTYVEQILNSPVYLFDEMIDKLIGKGIHNADIELKRHTSDVDRVLFEAIKLILKELKREEGWLSRFLYRRFKIELRKNKRREQLIFLGGQLKSQHSKVKSELSRVHRQVEHLDVTVVDLKRLEDGFYGRNIYVENEKRLNKSKFFIKEIESTIKKLQTYQLSLESKENRLLDIERLYTNLMVKIPRYYELREESFLALPPSLG